MTLTGPSCVSVTVTSYFPLETSAQETAVRPGHALLTPILYQVIPHSHTGQDIGFLSAVISWAIMHDITHTFLARIHTFCTTHHHHMPTAAIHFIFRNPVIIKSVIDPSEGLVSGQRSGSATGQHFWEMVGISVVLKDPRSVAGDYMGVLTQCCTSFHQPCCYIRFIMSLKVLSGHAKSTYTSSFTCSKERRNGSFAPLLTIQSFRFFPLFFSSVYVLVVICFLVMKRPS